MNTKKFLIFIVALVLLINNAHAITFDVKVAAIKDNVVVDEAAEFNLTIQNNLDTTEDFTIKKAGYPFWDMYTKPLENQLSLRVPAQGSASIILFVNPLHITSVDTYTLDTSIVLDRTGEQHKVPITVGIISTGTLIQGYVPTVLASVSVPEKVDPRKEFTISIVANNQNIINYTNLTLRVESSLFTDEVYFPLGPKEDKTVQIQKKLDSSMPPQTIKLSIEILKDDRVIVFPIEKALDVTEYAAQENLPMEESFLKKMAGIKVFSNNPDYKSTLKIETTPFKNLFSSTNPRSKTIKENGKYYLVWQVNLDQDKAMTVFVNENYRPLVVIILFTIVAIVLYFVFRSPIVVRKSIANVGMSEGGISEAKVVVRVKNRSSNQITNIEVMDNVPNIAHVEKEISIGSMQPHAILQHPKKGVMMKWILESLEPGDERVLSYKMRSRLPILGEFNLPAATARTKVGNKLVISNSNRVTVVG